MTYNPILQLPYTLETLKRKKVPLKVIIFCAMFAALGCNGCQVFLSQMVTLKQTCLPMQLELCLNYKPAHHVRQFPTMTKRLFRLSSALV